jgi:hypothetical protein
MIRIYRIKGEKNTERLLISTLISRKPVKRCLCVCVECTRASRQRTAAKESHRFREFAGRCDSSRRDGNI